LEGVITEYPHPPPRAHHPPPPQQRQVLPKDAYTPWFTRVLAFLIDWAPIWLVFFVPFVGLLAAGDAECIDFMYGDGGSCSTPASDFWLAFQGIALLVALAYFFWNFCYRQGKTGQSIGKSVMKFKVISEKSWQPIGFGLSLVRQIAHYIDQLICYIGYLFPLWDDKRQTIADKLMSTICVPVKAQPPQPPPQQY
jgi:uncharacterized RDD family membrane protein YckC